MREGFEHEKAFRTNFVKTQRFRDNWDSDTPNPELHKDVADLVLAENGELQKATKYKKGIRVLDIGSGPVSILRGTLPKEQITCADPLGGFYRELGFDVIPVNGEWLYNDLPFDGGVKDEYDVTHISNALDHTVNPLQVISEMTRVTRKGGLIIIQGHVNEATWEQKTGLHQYDITVIGNRLHIRGPHSLTYEPPFVVLSKVVKLTTGRDWFIFAFRKTEME